MEEFLNEIMGNEIMVTVEVDDGVVVQFLSRIDNISKSGFQIFGTNGNLINLNSLCTFTRSPNGWIVKTANNRQFFISTTRQN